MRRILFSAIVLALAGLSAVPVVHADARPATTAVLATTQLPRNVLPTHYAIAIDPHAENLKFEGKVAVTIDVLQPTATITLNALDMTFSKVDLSNAEGKTLMVASKVKVDPDAQTANFTFDKPIAPG
ncbi:MAG TPA: M1 family peptidase, partial [Xanthomonadaceae bacterium]|nr:M1 family peptidase [Xanthomonadaceae bacterium]